MSPISTQNFQKSWIVEGASHSLIKEGINKSDRIICLVYQNLPSQHWALFKRKLTRPEETWANLFNFYKHLFYKKYKLGKHKNKESIEKMLKPFLKKPLNFMASKKLIIL